MLSYDNIRNELTFQLTIMDKSGLPHMCVCVYVHNNA